MTSSNSRALRGFPETRVLSRKIISNQSIIRIEENFIQTKLRTIALRELLQRSMVFSSFIRTKNIKQVRDTFLQGFKKADQHVHRELV